MKSELVKSVGGARSAARIDEHADQKIEFAAD
jgi:hypothetical protein